MLWAKRFDWTQMNMRSLASCLAISTFLSLVITDQWTYGSRLFSVGTTPNVNRSEEHTSELQSRQYLHSFPTRRSSDLRGSAELRDMATTFRLKLECCGPNDSTGRK